MKYLSVFLLCSLGLLMTNCATTSGPYTPSLTKQGYSKTFNTSLVGTNFRYQYGNLGNSADVQYQAQAYCKNNNCNSAPQIVLSFFVSTSGNTIHLHAHNLRIHAGNKNYHWNQDKLGIHWSSAMGRIAAVVLNKSQLKQIAKSKKVTGVIAGDHFNWSYSNRKPLRKLVQKLAKDSG